MGGTTTTPKRGSTSSQTKNSNQTFLWRLHHPTIFASFIMASLHGDPRNNLFIKLDKEDVRGLLENGMMRRNLSDHIIHATCTVPSTMDDINFCLGDLLHDNKFSAC